MAPHGPEGFRKLLNWIWEWYHLLIIVTENRCPSPGESDVTAAADDQSRQRYIGLYLDSISRAIYEDGVMMQGNYVWSHMDHFSQYKSSVVPLNLTTTCRLNRRSSGYGPLFGIVHVDFDALKRTPKNLTWYLKDTFERRRNG